MTRRGDIDMEYSDRPRKPGISVHIGGEEELLHLPRSRPPLLAPEPVDVSRAIGRPPREWEAYLIIEARQRERARERMILP